MADFPTQAIAWTDPAIPAAGTLDGAETGLIVQDGISKRIPPTLWKDYINAMSFLPDYVDGDTVAKNSVVLNSSQSLMIALTDTSESAEIETEGQPFYTYNGAYNSQSVTAKNVELRTRYTLQATETAINFVRFDVVAGQTYQVWTAVDPLGANDLRYEFTYIASATGTVEAPINPYTLPSGTVIDVVALITITDPTPIDTTPDGVNYTVLTSGAHPLTRKKARLCIRWQMLQIYQSVILAQAQFTTIYR